MDFIYALDGVSKVAGRDAPRAVPQRGRATLEFAPPSLHVDGRVGLGETIFGDAFAFLQSVTSPEQTPKLTIPSPSMVHYRGGRAAVDETVYPDLDAFWADLTAAYAEEVRRLADARLHVPAVRRHEPRLPQRPGAARARARDRRRRRAPARDLHPPHQRGARRAAGGDGGHDPHVPRQLPLLLGGRGRLRLRRRGAVQRARRRRLLHGVGRRALRRLRAAALRAAGQARRARPRHHQARRARGRGRPQAPHRGGRRGTSTSTSSACRRSAASRRPSRATR